MKIAYGSRITEISMKLKMKMLMSIIKHVLERHHNKLRRTHASMRACALLFVKAIRRRIIL